MDVFISEEYVIRRRMEKKASALASTKASSNSHSQTRPVMDKNHKSSAHSSSDSACKGFSDNPLFACFSA